LEFLRGGFLLLLLTLAAAPTILRLSFSCGLFGEGIVQQALNIGLISRYAFAAREFSRKLQITYRKPKPHLCIDRFQDVRPFQRPRVIQFFIEKVRVYFLRYTIGAEPLVLIVLVHLGLALFTLLALFHRLFISLCHRKIYRLVDGHPVIT
jgi:hypothetical protein